MARTTNELATADRREFATRLRTALPKMSTPDRDEATRILEQLVGGESLDDYIRRVSPHLVPPRHLKPIIDAVTRARTEKIKVLITMPPRHAKTTTQMHALAWWLRLSPMDTCAYFTYSDRKGWSKSRTIRQLARMGGVDVAGDAGSVAEWRTRDGGGLFAGGVGSGLTGEGVSGLFVVDDPIKNRTEADSPIRKETIWEWFTEVVRTRMEGAGQVVMQTRWVDDDLIGRLLELGGWELIHLPAEAEEHDVLGRAVGDALWPERFPVEGEGGVERLAEIRKDIGEWSYSALYQGNPIPRTGGLFHRDWFKYASAAPAGGIDARGWDLQATEGDGMKTAENSWTVGTLARFHEGVLYLLGDEVRLQGSPGRVKKTLKGTAKKDGYSVRISIPQDPGQAGKAQVADFALDLHGWDVRFSPETGDKVTRLRPVAAQAEVGNIVIIKTGDPEKDAWIDPWLAEICRLPSGKLKDRGDSLARTYFACIETPPEDEPGTGENITIHR